MQTTTTTAQQVLARKSQRLLSIAPDATVFDALTLMAQHDPQGPVRPA
jgi:CBS domain-containing protein